MKDSYTVAEAIELLELSIQQQMAQIENLNKQASNYQQRADEQFGKMADIFEPLLPCIDNVRKIYSSLEEHKLINELETILIARNNLKRYEEGDEDDK